ncbi:MAG: hypothetical protein AAFO80_08280 [Pseudomonadota bacterium]
MATIPYNPALGERNNAARWTDAQIAQVKRLLADADRVEHLARGTFERVSAETGVPIPTLRMIHYGHQWTHVAPAPAEAVQ